MDELRQLTGAKIDVPGSRDAKDPSGQVEIQLKGTKAQVALAKKLIEEKKQVFDQTVSKTLEVDKKHHSALIGGGGESSWNLFRLSSTNTKQAQRFERLLSMLVALIISETSHVPYNSLGLKLMEI